MIDFGEPQPFRIPKISVPIVCQMVSGESISGEIFLDNLGSNDYNSQQLITFFNDDPPYFPIRTSSGSKPILIQKSWVAGIEIAGMMSKFHQHALASIAIKRDAVLFRNGVDPVNATIILDMPEDHSRLLDLLNLRQTFFPAIIDETYCLVNARQIYKIEES